MDRLGGSFGAFDDAEPFGAAFADDADDIGPEVPPSPVGQDERRMQVRAYNHWAALIGTGQFPAIADLMPETLGDFGPYGVLLDFSGKRGIDDPAIRFLGDKLAEECGGAQYRRLSQVPGRSLLSRITDHYLQIIANKAPIGFEAEFTNDRGAPVLYRGILLPWSSNGEDVDFVFGVINWKEMADAATADALLSAIDAALEAPTPPYEGNAMDRMLDLSGYAEADAGTGDSDEDLPVSLPIPSFGTADEADHGTASPFERVDALEEDSGEDINEDSVEASEWGAGFSGFGEDDTVYSVDYGDQGLEEGEEPEDYDGVVDPLADNSVSFGLASLVSRGSRVKQSVTLPGMEGYSQPAHTPDPAPVAPAGPTGPAGPRTTLEQRLRAAIPQGYGAEENPGPLFRAPVQAAPSGDAAAPQQDARQQGGHDGESGPVADEVFDLDAEMIAFVDDEDRADEVAASEDTDAPEGLYDCLAAARELAQTARSNEDRGRKALYQAVGRAYDFSLEAAANPDDFTELLVENGLTVQDRAPMTPVVKLVFGADYDKTRLTEYATVLGYAHRIGVARGTLDRLLGSTEGGLKGIVAAERQARKDDGGAAVAPDKGIRSALAKKLRKLEPVDFAALAQDGPEFALVMVRRLPSGELVALGEIPEDVPLLEKAARKMLG